MSRACRGRSPYLLLVAAIAFAVAGCSSDGGGSPPDNKKDPPDGKTGDGSGELTGLAAVGKGVYSPFDATPGPDGEKVYFTATLPAASDEEDPVGALFSVEAGGEPKLLAKGFVSPISVVVSTDGSQVFVADAGTDDAEQSGSDGVIYVVAAGGGDASEVSGTRGYFPRSLDLVREDDVDVLYFTGTDASGVSGVYKIGAGGGKSSVVKSGDPISDPSGIAVSAAGPIYFADTLSGDGESQILALDGDKLEPLADGIRLGYPAGIALTKDEKYLLVSGLQPQINSAVVYRIELATKEVSEFSSGIAENSESAGVHRAHNVDRYAWANSDEPDADGNGGGTVYLIGTKAAPLSK